MIWVGISHDGLIDVAFIWKAQISILNQSVGK